MVLWLILRVKWMLVYKNNCIKVRKAMLVLKDDGLGIKEWIYGLKKQCLGKKKQWLDLKKKKNGFVTIVNI